jgi:hypothetical protein
LRWDGGRADLSASLLTGLGVGGGGMRAQAPSFVIAAANLSAVEGAGEQLVRGFATQIRAGPGDEARQRLSFRVERVETLAGPWGGEGLFRVFNLSAATGDLRFAVAAFRHGRFRVTVELRDDGGTAGGGQDTAQRAVELVVAAPPRFAAAAAAEADYEVTVLETRLLVDQVPRRRRRLDTARESAHSPRHTHLVPFPYAHSHVPPQNRTRHPYSCVTAPLGPSYLPRARGLRLRNDVRLPPPPLSPSVFWDSACGVRRLRLPPPPSHMPPGLTTPPPF